MACCAQVGPFGMVLPQLQSSKSGMAHSPQVMQQAAVHAATRLAPFVPQLHGLGSGRSRVQ